MRFLFFMRDASRTGSEVALANLLRHAAGKGIEMAVVCQERGEMLGQLPPGVPVFAFERRLLDGVRVRAARQLRRGLNIPEDRFVMAAHHKFRPDVWYVNSVLQSKVLGLAKRHCVPCVLHTHELEHMLFTWGEDELRDFINYPKLLVASSTAAGDVFRTLGCERDVEVCYATIDPTKIKLDPEKSVAIRHRLGLSKKTFLWAMSGTLDPNKNPVRFVEVAHEMSKDERRDVHFIWLGGSESGYSLYAKELAKRLGVEHCVSWMGARSDDYYDHLNAADGFVLTSARESFSLVSVEAAYLGKPVVAFDCGGVREIVSEGMGTIVGSWNVSDLVREMSKVMNGETRFDSLVARERVKEFFVGTQGDRWLGLMRKYFPAQRGDHVTDLKAVACE